jgi:type IV pilus assembly protein PilF
MRAPRSLARAAAVGLALLVFSPACITPKRIQRAGTRTELGAAYLREGNAEGAIETLREATKLDPRSWRARNTLALAYAAKGQPELAEKTFHEALAIKPGEAEILVNYGAFLVRSNRAPEAVEVLDQATQDLEYRNPAIVQSNLSYALLVAGRPDDALPHAREAIRRAPKLCQAYFHLGLIQEARHDTLSALDAYKQLADTCPDEAIGGKVRTGCIQLEVGMADEGETALREAMRAAPNTPIADEARACLASRDQIGPDAPSGTGR